MNTIENLDKLIDSGIVSFKMRGRMKRPEYVAIIVKNYRKALDLGINSITKEDKEDILQIFNRDFTKVRCLRILVEILSPMIDLIIEELLVKNY